MAVGTQQLSTAQIRANFLAAAVERSQELSTQSYAAGAVNSFNMPHAGVGRYMRVTFSGTLSRTETAAVGTVTASPKAPFNIFSNANFTDYTGTVRVNAQPFLLYLRALTQRFGWDPTVSPESEGYSSDVYAFSIPTGTASSTTTSPLVFSFEVPVSLHRNTTEGSFPFAVPDGESTLTLTANALTGATIDFPFTTTGATVMSLTGTIYCTYYYFDATSGVALPVGDFQKIHELVNVRQNSNIAAGQSKVFTLETGRTYYQLLHHFVANNAADTVDVTRLKFLVDGNTPTLDEYLVSYLNRIRVDYGRDMPVGAFIYNFNRKPWTPASYGSLATQLDLASGLTLGTVYWLDTLKESMYVSQSALQAAGA